MLPKDVLVVDLGSDNWSRLINFPASLKGEPGGERGPGPLLVIFRGLKCLRAIDLSCGRPVEVDWRGTSRLDALAAQAGYDAVIALEENALARVIGHAQRELNFDDDYFKQMSAYLRGFAREWRTTIFTYPSGPMRIPILPHSAIDFMVRRYIPDDTLMLLAVTDNGKAWISAVVGYRDGDFWLLTSLDTLHMEEADLSNGQLEHAAEMLSSKYGGKVRGLAIEREALERITRSRFPLGAALWSINTRELRLVNFPLRWKAFWIAATLAATSARRG